jgi:WD40 repeat protein/serine/threonine protein kinase
VPASPAAVKALFLEAAEIDDETARAAFLKERCGGDEDLFARVDALLAADDRAAAKERTASFEGAAEAGSDERTIDHPGREEKAGTVIAGKYTLVEVIGEGGMGSVWFTKQTAPVKRFVALKLIKAGMDSKQVLARFEAERQALALMDHPNIAKVLDAGTTESGNPFFVMELVKGVPITRFCDERQLSTRERLELFVPVCQAIQHAHQKGVIHRDVKPTNVLVALYDDHPVPKVIDFGVAKAAGSRLTDASLVTGFGAIVGTPEYMSPEQAQFNQLDIDTRSDVYALGVLLYELLTGTTPIDRKRLGQNALLEVLRVIREEEPLRPSARLSSSDTLASVAAIRKTEPRKLTRLLRGELDWIVMKCLEKERSRRYETANGLARDLQHFLADEPVEACPPSVAYRLKKFTRNHRTALTTAAVLALLLVVGAAVSGVLAMRARQAQQAAVMERDAKEMALHDALTSEHKARTAEESERTAKIEETAQRKQAEEERDARRTALETAEGLRLTAQSSVVLPTNPGLSLLLAVEAAGHGPRRAAHNNALLAALTANREVRTIQLPGVAFASARFSRDGRFLLTTTGPREGRRLNAYDTMAAQVWDAATGRQVLNVRVPGLFFGYVDLSVDGRRLVTAFEGAAIVRYADGRQVIYSDHAARVWDVATGRELAVLKGHTNRVVSVRFSPAGGEILTASWDGTARVWDAATGNPRHTLAADKTALASASFSADGQRVLTFSDSSTNESRAEVSDLDQKQGWKKDAEKDPAVYAAAAVDKILSLFATKGSGSVRGNNQETLRRPRLWNTATGEQVAVLIRDEDRKSLEHEPTGAAFSIDGRSVFTGDGGGVITVWDSSGGKILKTWDRPFKLPSNAGAVLGAFRLRSLAPSADGRRLMCVRADNSISVVDTENGREVAHLVGFPNGIRAAAVNFDGKRVLVLPGDEIRMQQSKWFPGHDGRLVINVPDDRTVYLRDAGTGRDAAVFRGHEDDILGAAFDPDGRRVVTPSRDGSVRVWDAEDRDGYATILRGHTSALADVAFSADGRFLLTAYSMKYEVSGSTGGDREVRIWDASGRPVSVLKGLGALETAVREKLLGAVKGAQFSPDGQRVLVLSADYKVAVYPPGTQPDPKWTFTPVRILDPQSGKELVALQGFVCGVRSAAFSPDGRFVLTVSDNIESKRLLSPGGEERGSSSGPSQDDAVRVWDAATGAPVHTLVGKNEVCDCAAWSPNGRTVLIAGYRSTQPLGYQISMWDVAQQKETLKLDEKPGPVQEVFFSPDGKRIAGLRRTYLNDRELVPLWDAETGKTVAVLKGHQGDVTAVAFSPDSRWIATTSRDHTARVCDAATGHLRLTLTGHERAVTCVAFSPDGRWLVTGSDDGSARVWEAETGKEFITLTGHEGPVYAAAFSPTNQQVATSSGDGTARIWPLDPLPLAQSRKPRELTADERKRFGISDKK